MIFAAGFGTRMGALTRHRPKPLVELAGKPMIDRALDITRAAGIGRIVVNLHYRAQLLAAHLAATNVRLSLETPDILETGGGLKHALPLLGDGPVYTLNPDTAWHGPNPLALLARGWRPAQMDALLLLVPRHRARGHRGSGDFLLADDASLSRGPGQIYTGAQIVNPELLAEIDQPAFSLNLLWDKMLIRRRLFGISYPGDWCDVGSPEGLELAEDMLRRVDV